jgi:anti-sigma-K factor RskA
MTHDEAYSELESVALEITPADVSNSVRDHARTCAECGPELAAMDEAVAELGHLVVPQAMNAGRGAGIRSRLVTRARGERELRSTAASGPPDPTRGVASLTGQGSRFTPGTQRTVEAELKKEAVPERRDTLFRPRAGNLFAIAASLLFIAASAQLMRVTRDRDRLRAQLSSIGPASDSIARLLAVRDSIIASLTGPDVKVVTLAKQNATEPMAKMYWDRATNDWTIVTYNLPQPSAGKTYQVWLVTDDAKISAGTFSPDERGHAMMRAKYPLDRNALRAVAVTEEPMGGMPAPTGPMVILGSAAPE